MRWLYRTFHGDDCAADDARQLQARLIAEGWPWSDDLDGMMLAPPAALLSALDLRSTNLAELARRTGMTRQAIYWRLDRQRQADVSPSLWSLRFVLEALDVAWHDGAMLSAECTVDIDGDVPTVFVDDGDRTVPFPIPDAPWVCLTCGAESPKSPKSPKSHNCPGGTQ